MDLDSHLGWFFLLPLDAFLSSLNLEQGFFGTAEGIWQFLWILQAWWKVEILEKSDCKVRKLTSILQDQSCFNGVVLHRGFAILGRMAKGKKYCI